MIIPNIKPNRLSGCGNRKYESVATAIDQAKVISNDIWIRNLGHADMTNRDIPDRANEVHPAIREACVLFVCFDFFFIIYFFGEGMGDDKEHVKRMRAND